MIKAVIGTADEQTVTDWLKFLSEDLPARIDANVESQELIEEGLAERLAEGGLLPMYGMPTRTRSLYHSLGAEKALTIERDLELAVTEFAPGSQKTKDKAVYTSIGFTAPLRKRGNAWRPVDPDPLPPARWVEYCTRCNFLDVADEEADPQRCKKCKEPRGSNFRSYGVVIPPACGHPAWSSAARWLAMSIDGWIRQDGTAFDRLRGQHHKQVLRSLSGQRPRTRPSYDRRGRS